MTTLNIPFGDFERIYPTQNDIAFADYNGINGTEINYSQNLHNRCPKNAILSKIVSGVESSTGSFSPSAGVGLSIDIEATGSRAYIQGRYIEIKKIGFWNVSVDATKDNYIFLTLNIAGIVSVSPPAKLTVVSVAINSTYSLPVDSVIIAKVTTDATNVLSLKDMRPSQIELPISLEAKSNASNTQKRVFAPNNLSHVCFNGLFYVTGGAGLAPITFDFVVRSPMATNTTSIVLTPSLPLGALQTRYWACSQISFNLSDGRDADRYLAIYIKNITIAGTIEMAKGTWYISEWQTKKNYELLDF